MTTTQTGGGSDAAATDPPSTPAETATTSADAKDAAASTGPSATSLDKATPIDTDAPDDDDAKDSSKTPDELKRGYVRLEKRETKHREKVRAWKKQVADKEAEFSKAREELIKESGRISALQRQAEQRFGWAARGEQAWDAQDKVAFAKAIERMGKGASLAQITQWLAGALDQQPKGSAKQEPSAEEQAWRREKADWERQRAEEAQKAEGAKKETASAQKREAARKTFTTEFAKHPFLQNPDDPKQPDPDALREAFEAWEHGMKHRNVGETAREVAKRVLDGLHARELRKLKRFGLEPKVASKAAKTAEGEKKQGERLPEPPPTNKNGKPPSADETRASRIAAARRMSEMQRRGIVP